MKVYIGTTSALGAVTVRKPLGPDYDEILAKTPVHFYDSILQASILADEVQYLGWWKCPEEFSKLDFFKYEPIQFTISTHDDTEKERQKYKRLLLSDGRNKTLMRTITSLRNDVNKAFVNRVDEDFQRLHREVHQQLSKRLNDLPETIDRKYFLPSNLGLRGMIDSPYETIRSLNNDLIEANKRGCHLLLNEYNAQLIRAKYRTEDDFVGQRRFFKVLQRQRLPNFSRLKADDIVKLRELDSIQSFREWLKSESRRIYNEVPDEQFEKEAFKAVNEVTATIENWAYKTKPSLTRDFVNVVEFGITNLPVIGNLIESLLLLYRIMLSGTEHKEHYYIYFIIEVNRRTR